MIFYYVKYCKFKKSFFAFPWWFGFLEIDEQTFAQLGYKLG